MIIAVVVIVSKIFIALLVNAIIIDIIIFTIHPDHLDIPPQVDNKLFFSNKGKT